MTTAGTLPARPATAPPQVSSPGPVVAAMQDPLASLSERGQPESPVVKSTDLDATPPAETVAPLIAKRPVYYASCYCGKP